MPRARLKEGAKSPYSVLCGDGVFREFTNEWTYLKKSQVSDYVEANPSIIFDANWEPEPEKPADKKEPAKPVESQKEPDKIKPQQTGKQGKKE